MLKFRNLFVLVFLLFNCQGGSETASLKIDFEKYELANGLDVILHVDRSDPIAAVAILNHVGSARETESRTGFAHLFEHLLFKMSENLKEQEFFQVIQNNGGTLNGGTGNDATTYFEVVPNDLLERVLYMESDRMGFFINTVYDWALASEKEIVKNEKRQRVDNNPYGHTSYVIGKAMYPSDHPYNWTVIGSLEDLSNAGLDDVRDFYGKWYGPNNATLVVAGDFDVEETKGWIEKYFGEIKAHGEDAPRVVDPVSLNESKKLYHVDNFANLPQLTLIWPAVKSYHADEDALDILAELLSRGKKAPFYKVLVEDKKLTSNVSAFNPSRELAGEFRISVTAFAGIDLDDIYAAIQEGFQKFESDGITDTDMERIKARQETTFYNGISSILGKAFQLASYNTFAGDPGYAAKDIADLLKVTKADVMRVYNQYVKDKPFIATSFVPKGSEDLILEGSEKAEVVEEQIIAGAEKDLGPKPEVTFDITPSNIDRSVVPDFGAEPIVTIPDIWTGSLSNGMNLYGIEHTELPLVQFSIRVKGGMLLDNQNKIGVANLITDMMMAGTKNKTPEELEEAIAILGSSINMFTGSQAITLQGNTLARNFEKTMALVEEILMEPRWDENEFDLAKKSTLNTIKRNESNPNSVANAVFNKLIYGTGHILSNFTMGTAKSVNSITLDDLKNYYDSYFTASLADMHVVGDIQKEEVLSTLTSLNTRWEKKNVEIPEYGTPNPIERSKIYFVDIPDAKQSVIFAGYLCLSQNDEDYYPATVMNLRLGGNFNGFVNQVLRVEKGYTYGASSVFSGSNIRGPFRVSTSVRSNVTTESVTLIKEILETYKDKFTEEDLENTKKTLIKANVRRFETLFNLISVLQNISNYDLDHDYVKQREEIVRNMSMENINELMDKYIDPDKMYYVVVGDASTQIDNLSKVGYGPAILVDKNAVPVTSDIIRK